MSGVHPSDVTTATGYDIYRLRLTTAGKGWTVSLQNALAAVRFGEEDRVIAIVRRAPDAAASATVTLTAVSESDPAKTATATWKVLAR